jgi:SAM-dependent methyltransferase
MLSLDARYTDTAKRFLDLVGYDYTHWLRTVMYRECFSWLEALVPSQLDALEISSGYRWRSLGFKSFTGTSYPEFDICAETLDQRVDLIIADQVFEHLLWPYRAARNVHTMLRPGGYFLVTVPFMVRVHDIPVDCSRWTETGLRYFLAECGFPLESIRTASWGNRSCVKANFKKWVRRGWFRSLRNEPNYPLVVWALAQKAPATN